MAYNSRMEAMNYRAAGVDYEPLDAFKRACQQAAAATVGELRHHGVGEAAGTRGESAYLLETPNEYWAHVEEGLGTKNLVADALLELTGVSHYRAVGVDTVATIVNDLITCGALPLSVAMHAAVGNVSWFANARRTSDLAQGFAEGCRQAQAVWGGGETPALQGIVHDEAIVLAGSAMGRIVPKSRRIEGRLTNGDAIIFLASSGVHTNGLSLCRKIAQHLPQGYLTPVEGTGSDPALKGTASSQSGPGGTASSPCKTYGEELLTPSVIYVKFVAACQEAGLPLHYLAHVTGHGWRKLMRLDEPWVYRLTQMPAALPIFNFLIQHGPMEVIEAYRTFNMGVGLAVYVSERDVERTLQIAKATGYQATLAGHVEKQGPRKAVEIAPLGITFNSDELHLR